MPSFWSRIACVFTSLGISPTSFQDGSQHLIPGHNRPLSVQKDVNTMAIPIIPGHNRPLSVQNDVNLMAFPVITPPSRPELFEDEKPITCQYPLMPEFEPCFDTDKSCWLKRPDKNNYNDGLPNIFNIETNYEKYKPKGETRRVRIEIYDREIVMDGGIRRKAMTVNGKIPGPWIQACWGDKLIVEVKNSLKETGTTIHFHGIRMLNNCVNDGVNGVTQCPIAPGETFTYEFDTWQYGTSWYHSHYSIQYGDGVLGALTIHGPSSEHYDLEVPPVMMSDFSYTSFFKRWHNDLHKIGPVEGRRDVDGIMLNGRGIPIDKPYSDDRATRNPVTYKFERGKKHLLRLINHSVEATFVFSIDGHEFWVVSADFVPIHPYPATSIVIGIGQRYNIVVEPLEEDRSVAGNCRFWIRTELADTCDFGLKKVAVRGYEKTGMVEYTDCDPINLPDDSLFTQQDRDPPKCQDEDRTKLRPIHEWDIEVPENTQPNAKFDIALSTVNGEPYYPFDEKLIKWSMHTYPMWASFENPTFLQMLDGESPPTEYKDQYQVVQENVRDNEWLFYVITLKGVEKEDRRYITTYHPMHLHGHDFAIIRQEHGEYNPTVPLSPGGRIKNPARRDVVLVPTDGHVVVAFKADNPGVWLMHCHIAWHASAGLAMQLVEDVVTFRGQDNAADKARIEQGCQTWRRWATINNFRQDDSGV